MREVDNAVDQWEDESVMISTVAIFCLSERAPRKALNIVRSTVNIVIAPLLSLA